jgi:hypothetical protein
MYAYFLQEQVIFGSQKLQDDNCSVLRVVTGAEAAYNLIL